MKKPLKKWATIPAVLCLIAIAGGIIFSPYGRHNGFDYRVVVEEVEIAAPPSVVYTYLGNSANAARWSVYVDHIVTLNGDLVPDGRPGSFRRCFKNKDETGIVWDEEITVTEPAKRRQLTIFNAKNFPVMAGGLATEQLYDSLAYNRTRLRFTLFFKDGNPSLWDEVKMSLAAWEVAAIYRRNMQNIKLELEAGRSGTETSGVAVRATK